MEVKFDKGKIIFTGNETNISHKEVTTTPLEKVQGVLKCSSCGVGPSIKNIYLKGGTFVCPFCGTVNTLPNFGRTADGPHITNIRNTYYVNCNEPEKDRCDEDGVRIPAAEELLPQNILKTHIKDVLEVFGFKKYGRKD